MRSIQENICVAIETIAKQAIAQAKFDKTIQATVVKCQDELTGLYDVTYQDNIFEAYSNNLEMVYKKGTKVYVLIPANNAGKKKAILGSVEKLGVNYIPITSEENAYEQIGMSCIAQSSLQKISSYEINPSDLEQNKILKILYDRKNNINDITVNEEDLRDNIKENDYIILSSYIKTSLATEQQQKGNYGILLALSFEDNATGEEVVRNYVLDTSKMVGNPYLLTTSARQYAIYSIDGKNFKNIQTIAIFKYGFPYSKENLEEKDYDITFSNINLYAASRLPEEEISGYSVSLKTPKGNVFAETDSEGAQKNIVAEIKLKSRKVSSLDGLKIYWFQEDASVKTNSSNYCVYGGEGWRCLNRYNIIRSNATQLPANRIATITIIDTVGKSKNKYSAHYNTVTEDGSYKEITIEAISSEDGVYHPARTVLSAIVPEGWDYNHPLDGSFKIIPPTEKEWIANSKTLTIKKADVNASQIEYKCVVVGENVTLSKTVSFKNFSGDTLEIVSDSGTSFYYDNGSPTLTCLVNGIDRYKENVDPQNGRYGLYSDSIDLDGTYYEYIWGCLSSENGFEFLSDNSLQKKNEDYNRLRREIIDLQEDIKQERVLKSASEEILKRKKDQAELLNYKDRVDVNHLFNVNINKINKYKIFKCAVYKKNIYETDKSEYIGTASLTITNSLDKKGGYILDLTNGVRTFKYNEKGIFEYSQTSRNAQKVQTLSFVLYDDKGRPVSLTAAEKASIEWLIPNQNTLLSSVEDITLGKDSSKDSISIKGLEQLSYSIKEKYDLSKKNNNISISILYKDQKLIASTNFSFLKQGDSGTNGTEYTFKITPNISPIAKKKEWLQDWNLLPQYPTLYVYPNGKTELNFDSASNTIWFKARLYRDEECLFSSWGEDFINQIDFSSDSVKWSILQNKYFSNIKDSSPIEVDKRGNFRYNNIDLENIQNAPALIIKAELKYKGVEYVDTLPLNLVLIKDEMYKIDLVPQTGFNYAIYTPDGRQPAYDDTNPFTLKVSQNLGNRWEDISSTKTNYKIDDFDWSFLGSICNKENGAAVWNNNAFALEEKSKKVRQNSPNKFSVKPADDYKNECVTNGIRCILFKNATEIGRIYIPIHLFLNRYGSSMLNGWDGNSININEQGGFILTPQVGAGKKNEDNSFTGIFLGIAKESDLSSSKSQTGLIGYTSGEQSIFLDAETGDASFGLSKDGRIEIKPSTGAALIKSGDYGSGSGMAINFSSSGVNNEESGPWIKFGSGNFEVNKDGHLIAKGGGSVAGWDISDTCLGKGNKTSQYIRFYSDKTDENKYVRDDNNQYKAIDIKGSGLKNFFVDYDGYLSANYGKIGGWSLEDKLLSGGKGNNRITLSADDEAKIYSGDKSSFNSEEEGFYLSKKGLKIGNNFEVDSQGKIEATAGKIGGWTIENNYLSGANMRLSASGGIQSTTFNKSSWTSHHLIEDNTQTITEGLAQGWALTKDGQLYCRKGYIGPWKIASDGLHANSPNKWITLNPGQIHANGWSIKSDGSATFNNVTITGGSNTIRSSDKSGISINLGQAFSAAADTGAKINEGLINCSQVMANESKTLDNHIEELSVSALTADKLSAKIGKINSVQVKGINIASGKVSIGSDSFNISAGITPININQAGGIKITGNGGISIDGNRGATKQVNFSDGTYLVFTKGILTGGKAKNGQKF